MEQQRFEQLIKELPNASEPVTIPLNVKRSNGRTAPKSEEHKAKISAALKGRKVSDETKAKMSEARKGRAPANKGKKGQVPCPPRQNSCRLDKILNSGAMMRERRGAIRTGIQG